MPRRKGRAGSPFQIYWSDELREGMEAMARAGRRSLSEQIRIALEEHVARGQAAAQEPGPTVRLAPRERKGVK
jgi:hypothetical protein